MKNTQITPASLSPKQREAFNYQKISAILADYGYLTIRLADDWCGADFIAQHIDGSYLKVQLKSRLTVEKKYENKDLWICFPSKDNWFIFPHDTIVKILRTKKMRPISKTYDSGGKYCWSSLSNELTNLLKEYRVEIPQKALEPLPPENIKKSKK